MDNTLFICTLCKVPPPSLKPNSWEIEGPPCSPSARSVASPPGEGPSDKRLPAQLRVMAEIVKLRNTLKPLDTNPDPKGPRGATALVDTVTIPEDSEGNHPPPEWAIRSQTPKPETARGRFNDCKAYRASGIYSLAPWESHVPVLLSPLAHHRNQQTKGQTDLGDGKGLLPPRGNARGGSHDLVPSVRPS